MAVIVDELRASTPGCSVLITYDDVNESTNPDGSPFIEDCDLIEGKIVVTVGTVYCQLASGGNVNWRDGTFPPGTYTETAGGPVQFVSDLEAIRFARQDV